MSENQVRLVHVRMPLKLARNVKLRAVQQDTSVQNWLREAAEEKLSREKDPVTESV